MAELGRFLVIIGAAIVALGVVLLLAGKLHLPLGHLPGDVSYRGKHWSVYFPITTCIVLSLLLTLIFYFIGRWHR
jgi:hypothetical protein